MGETDIAPTDEVRNLGVTFDNHLSMVSHVNKVCSLAFLAIRFIGQIRRYLDKHSAEKLVHTFVTLRLDYYKSLLYGLPHKLISKLQRIQIAAARLVLDLKNTIISVRPLKTFTGSKWESVLSSRSCSSSLKHLTTPVRTIITTFSYLQTCTWSSFSLRRAVCCPTTHNKKLWCKGILCCWTRTLELSASAHLQISIYRPV